MRHPPLILSLAAAIGCTRQGVVPHSVKDTAALGAAVRRVAPVGGRSDSAERALQGDGFMCIAEEFGPPRTRCTRTSALSLSGTERHWVVAFGVSDGRITRLETAVRDIRR